MIGSGALSLSVAGQFAARGARVTLIDMAVPDEERPYPIEAQGARTFRAVLEARTGSFAALSRAQIVAVTAAASRYESLFPAMLPFVREGQTVVLFPASFGGIRLKEQLKGRDMTVCEAVSFPYVCDLAPDGGIYVHSVKKELRVSVSPSDRTREALDLLGDYFDGFVPARNFLETSMDNINMTLHPLPVLLNAHGVERTLSDFRHFLDGVTSRVGRLMERMDAERMAIGAAYGLELHTALDQLKAYYGERGLETLTDYLSSPAGPYAKVRGYGLDSRYIKEDVPYLVVAGVSLARAAGVPAPMMELCVRLACAMGETDYYAVGYTLEKLGLAGLSVSGILRRVEAL